MKALNLNGKIMIIPMAALDEKVRNAIKQEDGLQNIGGTDIFVYATGRLEEHPHQCCGGGHHHHHEDGHQCCGGEGHHHHHEDGHQCCGGGGHHHHHEDGHQCCGGGGHHHHHEDGHQCCGGGEGHHHHHEDGHQCCGGGGHHHHHEDGHQCCGGGGHHHHHEDGHQCCGGGHNTDEFYDHDEADETFIDEEDNYAGDQDDDLGTVRVINEPVVIVNTDDVAKLGFPVEDDMFLRLSPEGLTLLPGADVDKGGFQTGAITIRLEEE